MGAIELAPTQRSSTYPPGSPDHLMTIPSRTDRKRSIRGSDLSHVLIIKSKREIHPLVQFPIYWPVHAHQCTSTLREQIHLS